MRTTNDNAVTKPPVGSMPDIKGEVSSLTDEQVIQLYNYYQEVEDLDKKQHGSPSGPPAEKLQHRLHIRARYEKIIAAREIAKKNK